MPRCADPSPATEMMANLSYTVYSSMTTFSQSSDTRYQRMVNHGLCWWSAVMKAATAFSAGCRIARRFTAWRAVV